MMPGKSRRAGDDRRVTNPRGEMRMRRTAIIGGAMALGLCTAGGALAQDCPDGIEAAMAGVTIVYDDGAVTHYQLLGDGTVIEETEADEFGPGFVVRALYGIFVVDEHDLTDDGRPDESTRSIQDFGLDMSALPAPAPGLRWSGETTVKYAGEPAFSRQVTVAADRMTSVDYGGCVYDSLPVVLRHRDDVEDLLLGFDWLPSLEIAVFRSFADFGQPADRYEPLTITARGN